MSIVMLHNNDVVQHDVIDHVMLHDLVQHEVIDNVMLHVPRGNNIDVGIALKGQ